MYRVINKLDCSKDLNKDTALKFDIGKVKSEKYGEAMFSGYFLVMNRAAEFPNVIVKLIEERSLIWLNEMGLEEHQNDVFENVQLPILIAYTAPDVNTDKLELYFKMMTFQLIFDNNITKLDHLNKNDPRKLQEDKLKIAENLISIIENHGDGNSTAAAASKLNPRFKSMCIALSHTCRCGFQQMNEDDYKRFARELMDFIRSIKWIQEYHNSPYTENEYLFLRFIDIGVPVGLESICFAKGISISNEIRMHPLFQRYRKNACLHVALSNDILSLHNEIADDQKENLVLVKCQKYSLQRSISKTEKATNRLIIDLKKDGIKLKSYFPSDSSLKNYVRTVEIMIDGFLYWQLEANRYGNIKHEKYEVEYDFDCNTWLEQIGINIENMKEPVLRVESTEGSLMLPSLPLPSLNE